MPTLVHLDFKGLALSPAFLCDSLLPLLAKCGATGILLEWEDMLPFDGELEALRSPSAFTVAEVAQVLACMASLGLEAIPLVQTLGHCEYILKHEQFAHLREDVDDYGTLCPKVAQAAVAALLTQVVKLHPNASRVHIGCDEATLGKHISTRQEIDRDIDGPLGVLANHVAAMAAAARALGIKDVLMWHDAAAKMANLKRLLDTGVQLVVWEYTPTLTTQPFVARLVDLGAPYYCATAFKGGDACDALLPNEEAREANQCAWCDALPASLATPPLGIVLTGWSRFGHLLPLTESLPAGMSSLLFALALWQSKPQQGVTPSDARSTARMWLEEWNQGAGKSAAAVAGFAVEVSEARKTLAKLEEEVRTSTRPATAREPSPATVRRLQESLGALVGEFSRLAGIGKALLEPCGVFKAGGTDIDEWLSAKVGQGAARAGELATALTTSSGMAAGGLQTGVSGSASKSSKSPKSGGEGKAPGDRKRTAPTSNFRGVSKRYGRYNARIKQNGADVQIGIFDDEMEAARAYDRKAREIHGEKALVNFPNEDSQADVPVAVAVEVVSEVVSGTNAAAAAATPAAEASSSSSATTAAAVDVVPMATVDSMAEEGAAAAGAAAEDSMSTSPMAVQSTVVETTVVEEFAVAAAAVPMPPPPLEHMSN